MVKRSLCTAAVLMLILSACGQASAPINPTVVTQPETTAETIAPTTIETTAAAKPTHSDLYLPDVSVEDVILYFNEVCLDSEFVSSGDPSYVQKWATPIYYTLEGDYTDEDAATVSKFASWLNGIEGFPGMYETEDLAQRNLRICFTDQDGLLTIMGSDFTGLDGAVTFWYEIDEIYEAIVCCRTDLDQQLRNSVILEEIYNGLGPIQDTVLRTDSIIYQEFSQPQWLSPMDELILRLLYHPNILPGMDAALCAQVIRNLYY